MYPAYAKINLGLRILAARPDGYHDIETVFHRIALYDEIEFLPSPTIGVESSSRDVPGDASNLCYRAASLLQEVLAPESGVHIRLLKRIPTGAGLGGGSSDAATVLLKLPAFWNRTIDPATLHALATRLGADVAFFLGTGSALGRGRGDTLEFFSLDIPYWILLCNPGIHISTLWAYRKVKLVKRPHVRDLREVLDEGLRTPRILAEELVNDFEPAVFPAYPVLRDIKEEMLRGGAVYASMSGSGSSLYGFYQDEAHARAAAEAFTARGYMTCITAPHFQAPT
jgi:4-diphosphocytidyl-2-C-methyl-D-erythritol kinase